MPAKALRSLHDVLRHISRRRGNDVEGNVDRTTQDAGRCHRSPAPSKSVGWSARARCELVRRRAAEEHPERRVVSVTVHRCSPGSFRRSGRSTRKTAAEDGEQGVGGARTVRRLARRAECEEPGRFFIAQAMTCASLSVMTRVAVTAGGAPYPCRLRCSARRLEHEEISQDHT